MPNPLATMTVSLRLGYQHTEKISVALDKKKQTVQLHALRQQNALQVFHSKKPMQKMGYLLKFARIVLLSVKSNNNF